MTDGLFDSQPFGASKQFDLQFGDSLTHDTFVKDYIRKDGTLVKAHFRSHPDGDPFNNFSYPGNINPYTGELATGDPVGYIANHGGSFQTVMSHPDPLLHVNSYSMPLLNW